MAKLDWSEIQTAFYGNANPSSFTLSLESVKLLLSLLNDRAIFRGAWIVDGDQPTDAEWDDIEAFVDGTIGALMANKSSFRAEKTSDQAISSGVNTKVTFDDVIFDTNSDFDTGNNRFVVSSPGKYALLMSIGIADLFDANKFLICWLVKNGSDFMAQFNNRSAGGSSLSSAIPIVVEADTDDYFEVYVWHNASGSASVKGSTLTWFSGSLVEGS